MANHPQAFEVGRHVTLQSGVYHATFSSRSTRFNASTQTCREHSRIASAKQLWLHVLDRDIVAKGLILPSDIQPIENLSPPQLRSLVVHVLQLHQATTASAKQATLQVFRLNQSRSVTWLHLVRGQWLLVASSNSSSSVLSLFSVDSLLLSQDWDLVTEAYLTAPVSNGKVEVQADGKVTVALELRSSSYVV